jgi:hypothetical protein
MSGQMDAVPEDAAPPVVAGPTGTGEAEQAAQAEADWQKRYSDLQPEYTRATQENAELKRQQELYDVLISTNDPDTRKMVAEQLGYVLEDEPDATTDDDDPLSAYDRRLAALESQTAQREQQEADNQYAQQVRAAVDERLGQLGIDKADQDWVLAYAINALPANAQGLPDLDGAYAEFQQRETARQRAWAETKKRAPHIATHGQAATEVPNLDNRQARVDWMTRRITEGEGSF